MNAVYVKCPECGLIFQADMDREAVVCKTCGTPFVTQKAIVTVKEAESKNQIETPAKYQEHIMQARKEVNVGAYEEAYLNYRLASKEGYKNWEVVFNLAFLECAIFFQKMNIDKAQKDLVNILAYRFDQLSKSSELVVDLLKNEDEEEVKEILNDIYEKLNYCSFLNQNIYSLTELDSYDLYGVDLWLARGNYFLLYNLNSNLFFHWGNAIESAFDNSEVKSSSIQYFKTGLELISKCFKQDNIDYYASYKKSNVFAIVDNMEDNFKVVVQHLSKEYGVLSSERDLCVTPDNYKMGSALKIYFLLLVIVFSYFCYHIYPTGSGGFLVGISWFLTIYFFFKVLRRFLKYRDLKAWAKRGIPRV